MGLFRKQEKIRLNPVYNQKVSELPDNLMQRCPKCHKLLFNQQVEGNHCCAHCNYHLHFPAYERIEWLCDKGSFTEFDSDLRSENPLNFSGYANKLTQLEADYQLPEAIVTGTATIDTLPVAIGVMDKRFIMASMGTVVGEKIVRLFEYAHTHRLPVLLIIASGGARMQEGILSLMQMAKVSQTIARFLDAGLFYLALLTNPTTGGVTASFAMQADIILAEPEAIVGFAGKRVIEQTTRSKLPDNFQKAETVLAQGFIDQVVPRTKQQEVIATLLRIHEKGE